MPWKKEWVLNGEYERCTCKKSQEYWQKHDAEQIAKKETEIKLEQERVYMQQRDRLLNNSGLGERYKNATFESFSITEENRDAYNAAKEYADNFINYKKDGSGIIFVGTNGTGKTHLAAAICLRLINHCYKIKFETLINLLGKIKATYDDSAKKESEGMIVFQYTTCDLLIIDDLGEEKISEWGLEKLYYIINTRYENNLPVIITTNYDSNGLNRRLTAGDNDYTSKAIVSRIYEMCACIGMYYEDYRQL